MYRCCRSLAHWVCSFDVGATHAECGFEMAVEQTRTARWAHGPVELDSLRHWTTTFPHIQVYPTPLRGWRTAATNNHSVAHSNRLKFGRLPLRNSDIQRQPACIGSEDTWQMCR